MVVTGAAGVAPIADINDDLQRETSFYERALASAEVAISKLKALGIPTRHPDDFYAEMVKSDEHMKRVRAELIFEQTRQETTDERRKAREQKRYGKQVQAEKLKERTLQKKDSIKNLDKWRKQRKRDGFEDNGAAPEGFEDEKRRNKSSGGGRATRAVHPGVEAEEIVQGGEVRIRRTEEGTFLLLPESSRRFFFSRGALLWPEQPATRT
jgi:rRNA-processing protein EBP2